MRNSRSPRRTRRLGATGTSTTRPGTRGTICTTYFTTCTSRADGATTLRISIVVASATTGIVTTMTAMVVVQGSSFSLKKMTQTMKRVDREQQDFHVTTSVPRPAL